MLSSALLVFSGSFLVSIFCSVFPHARDRSSEHLSAPQAVHASATARLGGIAVVAGLVLGGLTWFSDPAVSLNFGIFIATAAPVFAAGLLEDLGIKVSVAARFFAAVMSGIFFIWSFGQWLERVDIMPVDHLLSYSAVAVPFTLFACAGIASAFNLIDGLHGMSSVVAITVAVSLALIAQAEGFTVHGRALALIAIAVAGFFVVNFPLGMLFLGDAGAYVLGHLLAWAAVSIVSMGSDVSAFAILLVFFWPVADTFLALARRIVTGKPLFEPDRLHFHHVVFRLIERALGGRARRGLANPLATVLMTPFFVFPAVVGVVFYDNERVTTSATLVFSVSYGASYIGVRWAARKLSLLKTVD